MAIASQSPESMSNTSTTLWLRNILVQTRLFRPPFLYTSSSRVKTAAFSMHRVKTRSAKRSLGSFRKRHRSAFLAPVLEDVSRKQRLKAARPVNTLESKTFDSWQVLHYATSGDLTPVCVTKVCVSRHSAAIRIRLQAT